MNSPLCGVRFWQYSQIDHLRLSDALVQIYLVFSMLCNLLPNSGEYLFTFIKVFGVLFVRLLDERDGVSVPLRNAGCSVAWSTNCVRSPLLSEAAEKNRSSRHCQSRSDCEVIITLSVSRSRLAFRRLGVSGRVFLSKDLKDIFYFTILLMIQSCHIQLEFCGCV